MSIKSVARRIVPSSIKGLILAYRRGAITKRLLSLPISSSGVVEASIPFVKLESGLTFYGYQPTRLQRYMYRCVISNELKRVLSEDAFTVALDVLLRYVGPESEKDCIKHGKYYGLEKGSTVVECGAYLGYYAVRAAEIVGESGRVVAIEPVPENLRLLSLNIEMNSFRNVIIVPKAVWKEKSVQTLLREGKQRASLVKSIVRSSESIQVECDTMDNILKDLDIDHVDFIRIQINGAEIDALVGMGETLKRGPKLLIAAPYTCDNKPSYEEVISILHKNGYSTVREGGNVFAWKG